MESTTALRTITRTPVLDHSVGRGRGTLKAYLLIEGAIDMANEIEYAAYRLMWVEEVHRLDGPYDLMILMRVPDEQALDDVIDALLALDGVIVISVARCQTELEAA